ncbi:MAG: GyrI protein [Micrococcales bacterium]|nr:MAG: GyrI protein [Micrococcales bacterium]
MDGHEGLLRIGTFSTLSRISVRMLRHYQDHGVLDPAFVDPVSGHRYYRPEQLRDAQLAVLLRDAGFSVESIARLLSPSTDPTEVEEAIDAQRLRLARSREDLQAQCVALDLVNATLRGHPDMTTATVTTLPEMTLATLRRVVPSYADETTLWEEMMPLLEQAGVAFPAAGIAGATFYDSEFRESDPDVEVWIQVTEPFDAVEPLACRTEPARDIVTARMKGGYSQMPAVTSALGAFIAERGLTTAAMFNNYRVSPAQDPDPNNWVTDVCFPIVADPT